MKIPIALAVALVWFIFTYGMLSLLGTDDVWWVWAANAYMWFAAWAWQVQQDRQIRRGK